MLKQRFTEEWFQHPEVSFFTVFQANNDSEPAAELKTFL